MDNSVEKSEKLKRISKSCCQNKTAEVKVDVNSCPVQECNERGIAQGDPESIFRVCMTDLCGFADSIGGYLR